MKKKILRTGILFVLIQAMFLGVFGETGTAVSKKTVALKKYNEFLSYPHKLWSDNSYRVAKTTNSGIRFRIFDINADGVPELLIYDHEASNAAGQLAVYSIVNGKVKYIQSYALWSATFYSNKKGTIVYKMSREEMTCSYQCFNGKKIQEKQVWYASIDVNTYKIGKKSYFINSKKVSKTKFKKAEKKLIRAKTKLTVSEGGKNLYLNTSANRSKYLK